MSLGLDTLPDLVTTPGADAGAGAEATTGVGGAARMGVLGAGAGAGVFTGAVLGVLLGALLLTAGALEGAAHVSVLPFMSIPAI